MIKARLLKRFQEQLQVLERELKHELPKEIKFARELGDLKENAEYHAAKERQGIVNAKIGMLKQRIADISMMNLDKLPHDKAAFGSTLELKEADGRLVVYQLVIAEDAEPGKGWISTSSPIGQALIGKEEGDEVLVPTPGGTRTFEILKLTTIHEE